jgi:hypothetical protein
MRIRDPGWKNTDPGRKKFGFGIRDKHPGSATLLAALIFWERLLYLLFVYKLQKHFSQSAVCEQLCNKSCKTRNALRVHRVRHHKPRDNKESSSLLPPFLLGL